MVVDIVVVGEDAMKATVGTEGEEEQVGERDVSPVPDSERLD